MNFCINCVHYRKGVILGPRCATPELLDPVTAKAVEFCIVAREYSHLCGRHGKYFVDKKANSQVGMDPLPEQAENEARETHLRLVNYLDNPFLVLSHPPKMPNEKL